MVVFGAVVPVHFVVGGHYAHGATFFHGCFEGFEVDFAHRPLGNDYINTTAVRLLVVEGVVLEAGGRPGILHSQRVANGQHGVEGGVFAEILVRTSANGQALDVHGRAEDDVFPTAAGLGSEGFTVVVREVVRPGGGQRGAGRVIGGGVGRPVQGSETLAYFFADGKGAVGVFDVLYAQAGNALG